MYFAAKNANRHRLTTSAYELGLSLLASWQAWNVKSRKQRADEGPDETGSIVTGKSLDTAVGCDNDISLADEKTLQCDVCKFSQPPPVLTQMSFGRKIETPAIHSKGQKP